MKKVIVVSKTHLDLGFTDYGENIRLRYIDCFIPEAIELAERVNTLDKKHFVWTTGSWILKEALKSPEHREQLVRALQEGNIAPHAMPFTTHTELLDVDTLDYGLTIVDELDKIRGKKTVAAKVTDVPGHTKGLVSLLARHGIKLLHIGVNGASALVDVPPCFLWKNGSDEVVVVYSGDYGGAFKSDLIDEVLYFDHTVDNRGAPSPERVLEKFNAIQKEYPDYEVTAGTMDDFAEAIWRVRDKLPLFEGEMGDSWIHGGASDPYKYGALRTLAELKNKWLDEKSMDRNSEEYKAFSDAVLCLGEHTCGMDSKMFFADYDNYLKPDFIRAREKDKIDGEQTYGERSYSRIEKSWAEKREYVELAVSALNSEHQKEARMALEKLLPEKPLEFASGKVQSLYKGEWRLEINELGGIGRLCCGDDEVIRENNEPLFSYRSFCNADYEYWLTHYSRDLEQTGAWALGDFARPGLDKFEGQYPAGRFPYRVEKAATDGDKIIVNLVCDEALCEELGAPKLIQVVYTLGESGLNINASWYGKDANRLTEAIYMHLYPSSVNIGLEKLGSVIDPKEVAYNGGRNLHGVQGVQIGNYRIINHHSPIASIGRGKILEFDNRLEDVQKDGLSFVLYNNVWGTNFPLWYEDNASFEFDIVKNK